MGHRTADGPTPGSPADLQAEADPDQVARTVVLRRLTAAPRTRHDLRTDLLRRNIPEEVADRVLDRFAEVGLVDDSAYASLYVESRQRSRSSARGALRHELRAKGVPDEVIDEALSDLDPEQERARARDLVLRKARSSTGVDSGARTRRLVAMLVRRGYSHGTAAAVVREVLGQEQDGGDPAA